MKDSEYEYLYSAHILDFVRVATEYCKQLEGLSGETDRNNFIDIMRGLLPMVYLKASLLGNVPETDGWLEPYVTEDAYDTIRHLVANKMGEMDDFLDVFVEDFKYSDRPVLCTISENLADLYQVLRELVETFRLEDEELMATALYECEEDFKTHWGQKLLNALRALHDVRFGEKEETTL